MLPGAGGVRGADRGHGRAVVTMRAAEALELTVAVDLGLPSGDGPTDGLATPGATGRGGAGARLLLGPGPVSVRTRAVGRRVRRPVLHLGAGRGLPVLRLG